MSPDGPVAERPTSAAWWRWLVLLVAATGVAVVAWVCATRWGAVRHGHPAYAVVLALTVAGSLVAGLRARRSRRPHGRWRWAPAVLLTVLGAGWIGATAWLRPLAAVEPALSAMRSGAGLEVTESWSRITLAPSEDADATGVFFQPGAKVDPRAYAAVLRPLAEAGHPVVIAKPPLGIALLGTGALDAAREAHPEVERWVVAGHSLGGVVAAMEADASDTAAIAPVVGLVLFASYPVDDLSDSLDARVLSISGSRDGLSTPEDIDASRDDLPADAVFVVVEGATHAFFGDYGEQPGDGTPTTSHDEAREEITRATLELVESLDGPAAP